MLLVEAHWKQFCKSKTERVVETDGAPQPTRCHRRGSATEKTFIKMYIHTINGGWGVGGGGIGDGGSHSTSRKKQMIWAVLSFLEGNKRPLEWQFQTRKIICPLEDLGNSFERVLKKSLTPVHCVGGARLASHPTSTYVVYVAVPEEDISLTGETVREDMKLTHSSAEASALNQQQHDKMKVQCRHYSFEPARTPACVRERENLRLCRLLIPHCTL